MSKKKFQSSIAKTTLAAMLVTGNIAPVIASAEQQINVGALPIAISNAVSEDVIPNEYIVSFKQGISKKDMESSLATYTLVNEHFNLGLATVKLTKSQFNSLKQDANIEILEPNAVVEKQSELTQYAHEKTNVRTAWEQNFKGKGIDIAVIDSGIAPHKDLNIVGGVSLVDYTTSYIDDTGHGTHVAGIIGALDNGVGTTGVASEANLYAVKVLKQDGKGDLTDIIAGINWAIQKGVDIINISIGTSHNSVALKRSIDEAEAKGIIVVASGGNTGDTSKYPALYSNVVSVSATNEKNVLASFSSHGENIKIAAPGEAIVSTFLNDRYAKGNGTSQAAPYVSGMLALYKEAYPNKTSNELVELLYQNALDLGSPGHDNSYGHGLVQFPNDTDVDEPSTSSINPRLSADKSWLYWDNFADKNRYRIQVEQQQSHGAYKSYRSNRNIGSEEFDLYLLKEGYQYRLNITPYVDRQFKESETRQVYIVVMNGATIISETEITPDQYPAEVPTEPNSFIQLDAARNLIYWDKFGDLENYRVKTEQQLIDGTFKYTSAPRQVLKPEFSLSSLRKGNVYRLTVVPRNPRKQFDEGKAIYAYVKVDNNGGKALSYSADFGEIFEQPPVIERPIEQPPVMEQPPMTEQPIEQPPVMEQPPMTERPFEEPPVMEQPPMTERPFEEPPVMEQPPAEFSVTSSYQLQWPAVITAKRYRVEMQQEVSPGVFEPYSSVRNVVVPQFDLRILPKYSNFRLTIVPFNGSKFDYDQAYKVEVETINYGVKGF